MPPIAHQYLELTKPRVVALIVFTAVIGMFLAVPGMVPLQPLVFGTVGIWLAAASAAAINHLIDQRIDRVMARTSNRPLATGTLTSAQVLTFAVALGIANVKLGLPLPIATAHNGGAALLLFALLALLVRVRRSGDDDSSRKPA